MKTKILVAVLALWSWVAMGATTNMVAQVDVNGAYLGSTPLSSVAPLLSTSNTFTGPQYAPSFNSTGAGTNQFGPTQFTNPVNGTAVSMLALDANGNVITNAVPTSSGSTKLAFVSSGFHQVAVTPGTAQYCYTFGFGFAGTTESSSAGPIGSTTRTLTNMWVRENCSLATNLSFWVFTNGVNTGFGITAITNTTTAQASNLTGSVVLPAGGFTSIQCTNGGALATFNAQIYLESY